jgi:hypothetical protein
MFSGALAFFNDAVTTVVQVKSGAAQIYGLDLVNTTGATAYLQVFFAPSASVILGTTAPDMTIRIAASGSKYLQFPMPVQPAVNSGLCFAGTTTATGSTGAAISVSAFYN